AWAAGRASSGGTGPGRRGISSGPRGFPRRWRGEPSAYSAHVILFMGCTVGRDFGAGRRRSPRVRGPRRWGEGRGVVRVPPVGGGGGVGAIAPPVGGAERKGQRTMLITLNDPRSLGVVVCRAADQLFFNWTTQNWEPSFDATQHLVQLTRMASAPSLFGTVQS